MKKSRLDHIRAEIEIYSPVSITEGLPDGIAQAIIFANLMSVYGRQLLNELAVLNGAYDLACKEVTHVDDGNCPGCPKGNKLNFPKGCNVPRERFWKCWRDHFMEIAEKA